MKIKEVKTTYKNEKRELKERYRAIKKTNRTDYKKRKNYLRDSYSEQLALAISSSGKRLPVNPPKRHLLEEIGNAVTHGIGSLLAVAALVLMLVFSENGYERAGAVIYFLGLFIMFTMSCLYHAFRHGSAVKRIFRRFDYSSIYLLIGATFAPVLISYIGGMFGWIFFAVQWAIIITGITFVGVFGPTRLKFLHIPLYVLLGWSAVILLPEMLSRDPLLALFILIGGVVYSVGIIPFAMKTKVAHFIWHIFVLAGALVQWFGVFLYIYL